MAISQSQPISPPRPEDKETLNEFSSILQDNLKDIFEVAHNHSVRTTAPTSNEGAVGDIFLVATTAGTFHIYAKFSSGWKSVALA